MGEIKFKSFSHFKTKRRWYIIIHSKINIKIGYSEIPDLIQKSYNYYTPRIRWLFESSELSKKDLRNNKIVYDTFENFDLTSLKELNSPSLNKKILKIILEKIEHSEILIWDDKNSKSLYLYIDLILEDSTTIQDYTSILDIAKNEFEIPLFTNSFENLETALKINF